MSQDEIAGSPPARKSVARKSRDTGLKAELDARIAEAEWLKSHYDEQLRAAFAQVATLQARLRAGPAAEVSPAERSELEQLRVEARALRVEVKRLSAAEQRYLDRIEELKEASDRDR